MKKSLLVAFALACAVTGNAQSVSKGAMVHRSDLPDMPRQKMAMANGPRKVKKSVDNDLYYTIPGALFGGWTVDGMGYKYSMALVPPFTDVTFANQNKDKFACSWFINGNDATENATENGDYVSNYSPDGWFYTPALQHKKIEGGYQFNEDNYWVLTEGTDPNELSLMASYSPELMMTPCDNHGHRTSNGNVYRNALSGYGFLSTAFLFGTGQVDAEDDGIYDYTAYGFEQTYNPLLAPMYVDEIHSTRKVLPKKFWPLLRLLLPTRSTSRTMMNIMERPATMAQWFTGTPIPLPTSSATRPLFLPPSPPVYLSASSSKVWMKKVSLLVLTPFSRARWRTPILRMATC